MRKYKKKVVLGTLIFLLLLLSVIKSPPIFSIKGNILNFLKTPLQISRNFFNRVSNLTKLKELIEENNRLKNQLTQLRYEISQLKYLQLENKNLRSLLALKEKTKYKLIPAYITSRDLTNWIGPVIINKGSRDGIRESFLTITDKGLAGVVLQVKNDISKIILAIDATFRIGAKIERNNAIGLLEGCGIPNIYKMEYISLEDKIEIGDKIITAGLSDTYPEGIPVGKVIKFGIQPGGFYQYALVEPFVDFSNLDYVACLIPE